MEKIKWRCDRLSSLFENVSIFARKCIFSVLSAGPIPNHIAFIMDGNRRFAKNRNLPKGLGHHFGFLTLMSMLRYCHELGVKNVTAYSLSIDNFKRRHEEVKSLMDVLHDKISSMMEEGSTMNQYKVRVRVIGNLKLLSEKARQVARRVMEATKNNSNVVLIICIAYSSSDEIVNSVQRLCAEKWDENCQESNTRFELRDIETRMYMAFAPDPDIMIRSSGENRLSNFLLWQSGCSYKYSPSVLWPEIGVVHLVWAILNFQRNYFYLDKKRN
ncbi:hypothetical protein LguiA_027722 [Lonicera macranthoides]